MNYAIQADKGSPGVTVLRRTRTLEYVLGAICLLIGLAALPPGLLLFLATDAGSGAPFFFTGFGLLFISGAYMLFARINLPEFLIFDNGRGILQVREQKLPGPCDAAVPYGEIEGFLVRTRRSGRSTGHDVIMMKRDGACWTICSSAGEKKARLLWDALVRQVSLDSRAGEGAETAVPESIAAGLNAEGSYITWKQSRPLTGSFVPFVILAAMGMAIFGARQWAENTPVYAAAAVFIAAVTVIALYGTLYNIGKSRTVTVTQRELKYREHGGPVPGRGFVVPLTDIASVMFSFSVSQGDSALYIVRKGEEELMRKSASGDFTPGEILQAIRTLAGMKKIFLPNARTIEKIAMERLVQKAIAERSGITGL